jgi:ribosome biogenesis GTPase A
MVQQASKKQVFPPEIAPYIDVAAYLIDARAPAATLYLDELLLRKEMLVLTRSRQAEKRVTHRWQGFFRDSGYPCYPVDSMEGEGFEEILTYLRDLLVRKTAVSQQRGIKSTTLRLVALGVPNVGKSTFLNQLIGKRRLRTGDQPGITKGRQWVRILDDIEVLDTPGVLRDVKAIGKRKPYWMLLNLMPYDSGIREEVIELLIEKLQLKGLKRLQKYYKIPETHFKSGNWLELLECVSLRHGYKLDNDDAADRASRKVIRDFQQGRFGRLSLQVPNIDAITSPFFSQNTGEE